jgi:hypothetical protein
VRNLAKKLHVLKEFTTSCMISRVPDHAAEAPSRESLEGCQSKSQS